MRPLVGCCMCPDLIGNWTPATLVYQDDTLTRQSYAGRAPCISKHNCHLWLYHPERTRSHLSTAVHIASACTPDKDFSLWALLLYSHHMLVFYMVYQRCLLFWVQVFKFQTWMMFQTYFTGERNSCLRVSTTASILGASPLGKKLLPLSQFWSLFGSILLLYGRGRDLPMVTRGLYDWLGWPPGCSFGATKTTSFVASSDDLHDLSFSSRKFSPRNARWIPRLRLIASHNKIIRNYRPLLVTCYKDKA